MRRSPVPGLCTSGQRRTWHSRRETTQSRCPRPAVAAPRHRDCAQPSQEAPEPPFRSGRYALFANGLENREFASLFSEVPVHNQEGDDKVEVHRSLAGHPAKPLFFRKGNALRLDLEENVFVRVGVCLPARPGTEKGHPKRSVRKFLLDSFAKFPKHTPFCFR